MNSNLAYTAVLAILLTPCATHAQSLGEAARQQKPPKSDTPAAPAPKKVYTNEDFGKSEATDTNTAPGDAKRLNSPADEKEKKQATTSADQWKAKIQKKKDQIAAIEERIDELEGSVNYVQNNRNIYTNAPEYNQHQHQKELAAERLKAELEQQKSELSDMQEQARQQGFGNSVYQ